MTTHSKYKKLFSRKHDSLLNKEICEFIWDKFPANSEFIYKMRPANWLFNRNLKNNNRIMMEHAIKTYETSVQEHLKASVIDPGVGDQYYDAPIKAFLGLLEKSKYLALYLIDPAQDLSCKAP